MYVYVSASESRVLIRRVVVLGYRQSASLPTKEGYLVPARENSHLLSRTPYGEQRSGHKSDSLGMQASMPIVAKPACKENRAPPSSLLRPKP